jgi:hypothetical protein
MSEAPASWVAWTRALLGTGIALALAPLVFVAPLFGADDDVHAGNKRDLSDWAQWLLEHLTAIEAVTVVLFLVWVVLLIVWRVRTTTTMRAAGRWDSRLPRHWTQWAGGLIAALWPLIWVTVLFRRTGYNDDGEIDDNNLVLAIQCAATTSALIVRAAALLLFTIGLAVVLRRVRRIFARNNPAAG